VALLHAKEAVGQAVIVCQVNYICGTVCTPIATTSLLAVKTECMTVVNKRIIIKWYMRSCYIHR